MSKYEIKKENKDYDFILEERAHKGTRIKKWAVDIDDEIAMFKYEAKDHICSEACSEKIAYEIAKVLGYPCARIELAKDNENVIGVLNYIFSDKYKKPHTDIVAYLNPDDKSRNEFYTISNIKNKLDSINCYLFKEFIKILIFDALIGEQDRHEENWGITEIEGEFHISPLYDNGDSLLNYFKNEELAQKFYDGIKDFDSYINKSTTQIYKEDNTTKYKHFELIESLKNQYHDTIVLEIDNINKLTDEIIENIVNDIPDELLTKKHKEYIILYLIKRREILLSMR